MSNFPQSIDTIDPTNSYSFSSGCMHIVYNNLSKVVLLQIQMQSFTNFVVVIVRYNTTRNQPLINIVLTTVSFIVIKHDRGNIARCSLFRQFTRINQCVNIQGQQKYNLSCLQNELGNITSYHRSICGDHRHLFNTESRVSTEYLTRYDLTHIC